MFAYALQAVGRFLLPAFPVRQYLRQGIGDCRGVQGIDQQSVFAIGDDIARAAVFGCDDRQPAGRGFNQRQTERLCQSRVDKYAA